MASLDEVDLTLRLSGAEATQRLARAPWTPAAGESKGHARVAVIEASH